MPPPFTPSLRLTRWPRTFFYRCYFVASLVTIPLQTPLGSDLRVAHVAHLCYIIPPGLELCVTQTLRIRYIILHHPTRLGRVRSSTPTLPSPPPPTTPAGCKRRQASETGMTWKTRPVRHGLEDTACAARPVSDALLTTPYERGRQVRHWADRRWEDTTGASVGPAAPAGNGQQEANHERVQGRHGRAGEARAAASAANRMWAHQCVAKQLNLELNAVWVPDNTTCTSGPNKDANRTRTPKS